MVFEELIFGRPVLFDGGGYMLWLLVCLELVYDLNWVARDL